MDIDEARQVETLEEVEEFFPLNLIEVNNTTFIYTVEDHYNNKRVRVYQIIGWLDKDPAYIEFYLEATLKWDGCTDFRFGEEGGYMHMCCKEDYENHKVVLDSVWGLGEKLIGDFG